MKYKFRMFYMQPPIKLEKKPMVVEFENTDFESAYQHSKQWIKAYCKKDTQILMLAQITR